MSGKFGFLTIAIALLGSVTAHSQGAPPTNQNWQGGFGGT